MQKLGNDTFQEIPIQDWKEKKEHDNVDFLNIMETFFNQKT